jgi:hypothetical protein
MGLLLPIYPKRKRPGSDPAFFITEIHLARTQAATAAASCACMGRTPIRWQMAKARSARFIV